jgi:tRNA1Val (adenine37-N6)-methyltransferase
MKVNTDALCLGAWAKIPAAGKTLDIGSGTGLISLMLAQRSQQTMIIGIEPHEESFKCTTQNFMLSHWHDRLFSFNMDLATLTRNSKPDSFDTIVSNPPYFRDSLLPKDFDRSSAKHMQTLTEEDLAKGVAYLLSPGGYLNVIYPPDKMENFISICSGFNLHPIRRCSIHSYAHSPAKRKLVTFSFNFSEKLQDEKLVIYADKGIYSMEYKALLNDFLTIF